jgi:ketosteroid isomerase-like protein
MMARGIPRGAGLLAGAIMVCVAAGTAWVFAAGTNPDVAQLTKLSHDWDAAIVAKREAAVAGNMADDFRIIDGYGNVDGKAAFVRDIMDPKLLIDPYTVEDFEVRLYGDVALLSGRTLMTGKHDGKPFTSNYRYIDVYVRRAGAWRIVSVQITRFPPKNP